MDGFPVMLQVLERSRQMDLLIMDLHCKLPIRIYYEEDEEEEEEDNNNEDE